MQGLSVAGRPLNVKMLKLEILEFLESDRLHFTIQDDPEGMTKEAEAVCAAIDELHDRGLLRTEPVPQLVTEPTAADICEPNGYTSFENAVQKEIADLVPIELARPISTRVGSLYRAGVQFHSASAKMENE
jgi:hypothetical protein